MQDLGLQHSNLLGEQDVLSGLWHWSVITSHSGSGTDTITRAREALSPETTRMAPSIWAASECWQSGSRLSSTAFQRGSGAPVIMFLT